MVDYAKITLPLLYLYRRDLFDEIGAELERDPTILENLELTAEQSEEAQRNAVKFVEWRIQEEERKHNQEMAELDRQIATRQRQIDALDKKIAEVNAKIKETDERIETSRRRGIVKELCHLEYPGIPYKMVKSEPFMADMIECSDVQILREKLSQWEDTFLKNPGSLNYSGRQYNGRH